MKKTIKTCMACSLVAFLLTPATAMAGNDATLASATAAQQQAKPVKGNVVDENGEPLIGVSVKIVGAYGGAITDINGDFSVNGAEGRQLQFSYAGYKTKTVTAGNGLMKIALEPDALGLDEVVVVGYGTMKKSDLTGSTSNVKTEAIMATVTGNALEALQGKAAGVAVFNDNKPGASPVLRIRGTSSINAGNDPLYVVDGFPLMNGDLSDINPADIESMEVLKDASSTAIYGSRGANGVVMITTKSGKAGRKNLSFNASLGTQMPGRKMNLIKGRDFINFTNAARVAAGGTEPFPNGDTSWCGNPNADTDWEDLLLRDNAWIQNYNLTFDGQANGTAYMLSGGYYKQDGLVENQGYEKFSMHSNLRHEFNKWLTVGASLQFTYSNRTPGINAASNVARYGWPTDSPWNENGELAVPVNPFISDAWNPLIDFDQQTNKTNTTRVIINTFAEAKILPELTYRLSIGYDTRINNGYNYNTSKLVGNMSSGTGNGGHSWNKGASRLMENILTYSKQWGDHRFSATGVYSWQDYDYRSTGVSARGFEIDALGAWDITKGVTETYSPSSNRYDNKLISYTGRVTYAYKDKYLLTATARWDGSSRFGKDKKWGFFPSVGLAWRATEESFMQSIRNVVSDFKVRASFGVTGNQEIGNYQSLARLESAGSSTNYVFNGTELSGYTQTKLANADLQWERTNQWDFGFDLGLFSRFNINFDYYIRDTDNLLYEVPLPKETGFSTLLSNVGKTQNKGFEITVGGTILKNKDWFVDASVNYSHNTNKIKELYNVGGVETKEIVLRNDGAGLDRRLVVGEPIDAIYARHSLGIIQTQAQLDWYKEYAPKTAQNAQLGDEMYEDLDGDGSIGANDYINIGSMQPKHFYGINISAGYKDFSINIYGQGAWKYASIVGGENSSSDQFVMGYTDNGSYMLWGENNVQGRLYIPTEYAYERMWSPTNTGGEFPRAGANGIFLSDRTNADWNYFILKNIQLNYDFTRLLKVKTIKGLKVNLNFQNFVTFANHRGYNPVNGDISTPWAKSIMLGVDLKF